MLTLPLFILRSVITTPSLTRCSWHSTLCWQRIRKTWSRTNQRCSNAELTVPDSGQSMQSYNLAYKRTSDSPDFSEERSLIAVSIVQQHMTDSSADVSMLTSDDHFNSQSTILTAAAPHHCPNTRWHNTATLQQQKTHLYTYDQSLHLMSLRAGSTCKWTKSVCLGKPKT